MFRTKTDVAADKVGKQTKKATKEAKKVGKAAAARGEAVKGSVLATAATALHSLSDSMAPKAAAAAEAAKGSASNAKSVALDKTADARAAALDRTADARAAAMDKTADAREAAKERAHVALDKATQARDSAVLGLDRGVDAAVPVMQQGVSGVSEKVDHARDRLVDDLLPKLQDMLNNAQASKDDLLAKSDGTAGVVLGAPKKRAKKGGVLIAFGVLAAIGAGVAYYLSQQKSTTEKDTDPWAGSNDANASSTAKNAVAQTTAAGPVKTSAEATELEQANETDTDDADAKVDDSGDEVAEVSAIKDNEVLPVMIDVDDVPGTDPDAQAGFGTDFSDTDGPDEGKHRA